MEVEAVLLAVTRIVHEDAKAWNRQRAHATLPRLTLTYAQSIDGSIAAQRGIPTILSGASSMKMTHLLRTLHDGILVGIGTILADNPSLNSRLVAGENPQPIIIDTNLQCPLGIKLFTSPTCVKPILLCVEPTNEEARGREVALRAAGARVLHCRAVQQSNESGARNRIDLRHAFERLHQEGVTSIMVEGGASIILACLQESAKSHFIDRVVITVAPTFIGGLHAVNDRVSESGPFPRLLDPTYHTLDKDLVIVGKM